MDFKCNSPILGNVYMILIQEFISVTSMFVKIHTNTHAGTSLSQ